MFNRMRYFLFLLLFLPFSAVAQIEFDKTMLATEEAGRDETAKPPIPAKLKTGKPQLFCFQGKCGYVLNDSFLIPLQYMELEAQYSDFMVARRPDMWYGVINKKGEIVLPFDYWGMKRVAAGTILAGLKGQGYGLLNPQGKVLVPLEYKFEYYYNDSVMVFHKPGKQKIIKVLDADHYQVIMEGTFEDIGKEPGDQPLFTVKENGLWGLMDYNKRLILPCVYTKIQQVKANQVIAEKDGKWGVVSLLNKVLIPFEHGKVTGPLRYGCYRTGKEHAPGKWFWGLTDTTGQTILPPEYESVEQSYNCDFFKIKKAGKAGLADASGKLQIPLQFGEIYEQKHTVYVEKKNFSNLVSEDSYGLYFKTKSLDNDQLGLWQIGKGELLKPAYEWFEILQINGPFAVTQNGKKALFNGEGKQLTGFEYNFLHLDQRRPNLVKAGLSDQKHQVLRSSDGKPVEAEFYDEILPIGTTESAYFMTKKDRLAALHQPDGRRITPHKYTTIHICTEEVTLADLPKDRVIVACAYLANNNGVFFLAIDDAGAEYVYKH